MRVPTFTLKVLAATLGLTFATLASAEGPGHMRDRLRAADTNADGAISRDEAKALPRLAEHFDAIDTNKDGQLSREELRAAMGKAKAQRPDVDGDKRITREEAAKHPHLAKNFDAIDTNKDGALTRDEIARFRGKHQEARFDSIDQNKDGVLSRVEVESRAPMMKNHFDAVDTNKDGVISREELRAAKPAAHPGGRA